MWYKFKRKSLATDEIAVEVSFTQKNNFFESMEEAKLEFYKYCNKCLLDFEE